MQEVCHNKGASKIFCKIQRKYICRCLFFSIAVGCRLRRNQAACAFLWILQNFKDRLFLIEHVRTAAFDMLGYPYIGISSVRFTLKKYTVFSRILVFIHFKSILESCTTSGVYLEPYQTSMMKRFCKNSWQLLAVVFSQKYSIIDIWQCSKYGSADLFFIFVYFLPLHSCVIIRTFCFPSESV